MFKVRWFLLVCALIVLANAAPFDTAFDKDSEAKILTNEYTIDEKGNYKFSFKTSNGMTREETGTLVNEGQPNEHVSVIGRYTYFNPEGKEEKVEYWAGEDGYNILRPKPELVEMTLLGAPPNVVASLLGK